VLPKLTASAVLAIGVAAFTAAAQSPYLTGTPGQFGPGPGKKSQTRPPGQPGSGQPDAQGSPAAAPASDLDSAEALVRSALANDGDVRMAQAKLQLAEAELLKARQIVVLKVMTLKNTIEDLKGQVALLGRKVETIERLGGKQGVAPTEVINERLPYERAKRALATAELELKLLTGGALKELGMNEHGDGVRLWDAAMNKAIKSEIDAKIQAKAGPDGPIPARIHAALDKPVKLGAKGEKITFSRALEIFKKEAGLDVPVRDNLLPEAPPGNSFTPSGGGDRNEAPPVKVARVSGDFSGVLPITSEGEELPVGAWFQVYADANPSVLFVVRDYGLLVTNRRFAAKDVLTVNEFWKQPAPMSYGKSDLLLVRYAVSAQSAEAVAKELFRAYPTVKVDYAAGSNEILVVATPAQHAAIERELLSTGRGKVADPPSDPKKP
jgi:hypothetical protein